MKKFLCGLLAAIACIGFAACVPSNMDKAEAKMEDAGYLVVAYSDKEAEGLVGGMVATKITKTMTALLFESSKDAKEFLEETKETGAKQDGKWVYWGTEEAIEDFTK